MAKLSKQKDNQGGNKRTKVDQKKHEKYKAYMKINKAADAIAKREGGRTKAEAHNENHQINKGSSEYGRVSEAGKKANKKQTIKNRANQVVMERAKAL